MATQSITVDGVSGDTENFSSGDVSIVSAVSDGDTGTSIVNTAADKTLVFSLQGTSDFSVLSGATLQQAQVVIVASQSGKGAVTGTFQLLNSSDSVLANDDFATESDTATEFTGTAYTADGAGFSEDVLNGMQVKYVTTNETQPRLYTVNVTITYVAASSVTNQITMSSGTITISSGEITI